MDRPKLSTAEIEALLPESSKPENNVAGSANDSPPDRAGLSTELVQELRGLFDRFATHATRELQEPLRGETDISFATLQEVSGQETLARIERPTCIFVVKLEPVADRVILELPYATFFPMLDRLLGGGQHACPKMRRPLTRIERRLSIRFANYLMAALCQALPESTDAHPELIAVECDPRVLAVDPSSHLVMAQCHVQIGGHKGGCNVWFASDDLQGLERTLQLGPYAALVERSPQSLPGKAAEQLTAVIGNALVDVSSLDTNAMDPGQILWTDAAPDDPVLVYQGGKLKYVADKGLHQGQKAVRVLKTIS